MIHIDLSVGEIDDLYMFIYDSLHAAFISVIIKIRNVGGDTSPRPLAVDFMPTCISKLFFNATYDGNIDAPI